MEYMTDSEGYNNPRVREFERSNLLVMRHEMESYKHDFSSIKEQYERAYSGLDSRSDKLNSILNCMYTMPFSDAINVTERNIDRINQELRKIGF